jgi:ATP-dependent helicase/nuclease subunit A
MVEALEQEPAAGWAWAAARTPLGALVPALRATLATEGVAAALRALAADPRVAARYARLPLARRRLANLARLADEEGRAGVALDAPAFVARLAERRRLGVDAEEAGGEDLGSRGVRLLTIHQAKGLEWPVVFLPDCQRPFDRRDLTARVLALPVEEGLHLACHPGADDGGEDDAAPIGLAAGLLADEVRVRQLAEQARLFYVACTRAREELHALCAGPEATGPLGDLSVRCYADWFVGAGTPWSEAVVDLVAPPAAAPRVAPEQAALPPLASTATSEESVVRSVTDLLSGAEGAASAAGAGERSRARALGTALHAALARYEPGMARAQAESALAPFRAGLDPARAQRLLRSLTDPELIPGYRRARTVLREQPVIGALPTAGDAVVVGVCDLLVQHGDGAWWIYDYKSGGAADELTSAEQLRSYAALLAPHLDGPVAGIAIIDLESGEVRPVKGG